MSAAFPLACPWCEQGYGDLHAYSTAEALFVTIYCFINIGVAAYIVGTITLLVVRSDEKTGQYRWGCVFSWGGGTYCQSCYEMWGTLRMHAWGLLNGCVHRGYTLLVVRSDEQAWQYWCGVRRVCVCVGGGGCCEEWRPGLMH